jgi:nitroreductase
MEFGEVVRRRRMCRDFLDRPIDPGMVDGLLEAARRAPSAGHTQGWAFVVLEGRQQVGRFWALDADPAWLAAPTHPGLLRAPVIVVPLASPSAYLTRYAEADKVAVGRAGIEGWPAPYWTVDAAFATMSLLLAATDAGLGALFFALHGDVATTMRGLGVPDGWEALGAVALGWPATGDRPSSSTARGRRPWAEVVHRGGW